MSSFSKKQTSIFISYTSADESFKQELQRHLQSYLSDELTFLRDSPVEAGTEFSTLKDFSLQAEVIVILLSKPYLDIIKTRLIPVGTTIEIDRDSRRELNEFLKMLRSERKRILPILVEDCPWEDSPFSNFILLPFSKIPFAESKNSIDRFAEVVAAFQSILELLENYKAQNALDLAREKQLEELTLSEMGLRFVPFDLLGLPSLTNLWLERNSIEKIEHLDALVKLEHLSFDTNKIKQIANLKRLGQLKVLNLTSNEISELENLEALTSLVRLEVRQNQISSLQNIRQTKKLEVLGISNNQIDSLAGIEELKELRILYASHNKLRQIDELSGLKKLTRIILTNNQIESIKPMLERIREGLFVGYSFDFNENNPGLFIKDNTSLKTPPVETVQQGREAILKYFSDADQYGVKKLEMFKMILVGNSRVGKTNLSQFLRTGKIDPETSSTHLLDIQPWHASFLKSEDDTLTRVAIFDFGGQDYYHDSHRLYYSHDTAYILLWEPKSNQYEEIREINPKTKETLIFENFPLEYWLESIQYNLKGKFQSEFKGDKGQLKKGNSGKTVPVLVLQNKIDEGEGRLNQDTLTMSYPMIWGYFGISLSKEKRTKILEEILSDYFWSHDLSGRELVNFDMKIFRHFLDNPDDLEILSLDDFWKKCIAIIQDASIPFNKDNAQIIAQILSNSGLILFEKIEDGKGWIYTNIRQLNELVKQVMEVARSGNEQGIFTKQQLQKIRFHEEITGLLVRNNSIIEINRDEFLAPQFLPTEPDKFIRFFLPGFVHTQVRYLYRAFFHKILLLNLFSKYLEKENIDTTLGVRSFPFWRNGIIIKRENPEMNTMEMVYVEFKKTKDFGLVNIRTQDPFNKNGLEQDIVTTLDELNRGWTHEKQMSADSISFFNIAEMEKEVEAKQYSFTHTPRFDNTDVRVWEEWKTRITDQQEGNLPQNIFSVFDFKHIVDFKELPKKLFISYSSKNSGFIRRFATHLEVLKSNGSINPWYDRMIESGTRWDESILEEMNRADLIIFMLSPDFLATEYVMKTEVKKAIDRFPSGNKFFFVQLTPCSWDQTILRQFQQTDDSQENSKNIITIGTPENDGEWQRVMAELIKKLKIS
ncbi:hypothetical protein GCM10009119_31360 [Algoriphagus jejuensis]|uniref:TIR domain-containing protein n=1 Tax=Algoriphagus jejuensis TaxID=419934 RepID=A0ABN1N2R0_9BACT